MQPLDKRFMYTACCAFALGFPGNVFAQTGQSVDSPKETVTVTTTTTRAAVETAFPELPDSPGVAWSRAQDEQPQQGSSTQSTTPPATQTATSQTTTGQDQTQEPQQPQRPVGTAAAEEPKVKGITAAQPAGVAIAAGKQHRVRTIVIKVGAIVGAGVALGSVIALSEGTPSKPPGAR